jgi:hypothetical protein
MSKRLILLYLLLITNSFVYAELDEEKFGKSKGYPFAVGVPFRIIPEFRVGAYTGKGLSNYKNNNGWLQPNDAPKPLPKVFVEFKTLKPDDIVKKKVFRRTKTYHKIRAFKKVRRLRNRNP